MKKGVIKKFIGSEPCKFNRDIVQYLLSNACGDYAIYFVYRLSKNDRLNDILNVFNSDLLYNDYFVTQFVKHIYIFVLLLTEISEMNTLLEIYFGGDKCINFDSLIILQRKLSTSKIYLQPLQLMQKFGFLTKTPKYIFAENKVCQTGSLRKYISSKV